MPKFILYTDGASRGNPGVAGCGVSICDEAGTEVVSCQKYLGQMTNNQAEYEALLLGLEEARRLGATELIVRADSQLMIRQLNGEYKVKNENIIPLFRKAQEKLRSFSTTTFEHIRREFNKRADQLANLAIDERD